MADSAQLMDVLDARVRRREERRDMFKMVLGAAAVGTGAFAFSNFAAAQTVTDADILNFALNLEYLESNFYSFAVNGTAIPAASTTGTVGTLGVAVGGHAVPFSDPVVAAYAREIAADELAHVNFLRSALGTAAVVQPQIDVGTGANSAFSKAAQAAGLVPAGTAFDPYADDISFLLGAFIFEDVGVTAYKGASPLISNKTYLEAAAGILAAEAYHASIVRTVLYAKGVSTPAARGNADAISNARDSLDGTSDDDQGISPVTLANGVASNIVPTDANGIAYSRTTGAVLNIVYLTKASVTAGGFFPNGLNGSIRTSTAQP